MKTGVRLESVKRTAFDASLARLGGGRLMRAEGATYFETEGPIDRATYELALAGVRIVHCDRIPVPEATQRAAIGLDLTPLDSAIPALDIVEVRCIALGDASATLLRRRIPWLPRAHSARASCRRLLRDEDAVLTWRRIVWCSMRTLRASRQLHLRPVVFDSDALRRQSPRWTYVSAGAIEGWAFA